METIKAFQKDEQGYYCQPTRKKFYYEEGKTYKVSKNKAKMCKLGFHASANYDISDTVDYYTTNLETIYYGIVDLNVINSDSEISVGNRITILKFLPQNFNILSVYDKTGKWIYYTGFNWKEFDYKLGFNKLIEVDKTGELIYLAGCYWKEFDYKKGLKKLFKIDKTGIFISLAEKEWKEKI